MDKLVSIALCTYNGEKYIIPQLESVIAQSYKNIEIVILDDNSSDTTIEIIKKYKDKANIWLYENEKKLGYIKNFEKAIGLCKGDYIAFCDQDDLWHEDKIQRLVNEIGNNLLIYSDSELIDERGNSLNLRISDLKNFVSGKKPSAFIFNNCVSGHSMMIKKELVEKILPLPANVYYDWYITFVASLYGKITFIEESLVKYRQHSNNSTDIRNVKVSRKEAKKINREKKRKEFIYRLKAFKFAVDKSGTDMSVLDKLLFWYNKMPQKFYCFSLYFFLRKNRKSFYQIFPKSDFQVRRIIFKEGKGEQWYLISALKQMIKL